MADQPPPGGTLLAMPGAQQTGGDQPPPGGTLLAMPGAAAAPAAPAAPAATPELSSWEELKKEALQAGEGAATSFSQVPATIGHLEQKIPVVGPFLSKHTSIDRNVADFAAQAAKPIEGVAGYTGAALETMAEWMLGEGELKALTHGERMAKLATNVQLLEKTPKLIEAVASHPIVQRMLMNAGLGTTQAAAHGADPTTALATGAVTGVGGAALDALVAGGAKVASLIKPSTEKVLGETVPVLASQKPGASPLAADVASIGSEQKTAAAQQLGAQRGIVNRARETAKNALDQLNEARQARWEAGEADFNPAPAAEPPEPGYVPPDRKLPSGQAQLGDGSAPPSGPALETGAQPQLPAGEPPASLARTNEVGAYEGDFPEQQPGGAPPAAAAAPATQPPAAPGKQRVSFIEEKPPNFQPIDSNAETQGVNSFKDAADKIREHARPIYQRLDSATGGEFSKLRKGLQQAYDDEDYAAVREHEDAIDGLFDSDKLKGKVDTTDYKAAKSAWRTSKLLDAVHSAVSRGFNIPDATLAADAGVWRGISGAKLQTGINRLVERYGRAPIEKIIGSDGLTGLTKIASLTQSPRNAQLYGQVVDDIAHALPTPTKRGLIGSTLNESRKFVLHWAATSPTISRLIEYALKNRVPSKVYAPLISTAIQGVKDQDQTPQETQP